MDFFDNVVNKSNAILKERLNNPFGAKSESQDQSGVNQASQEGGSSDYASSQSTADNNNQSSEQPKVPPVVDKQFSQDSANGAGGDAADRNSQFAAIAADAEAVAQKAAKGAQKFGTFLFSMANKAGQTVSQTAKQAGQTVSQTAKQAGQTVSQTAKQVKQAVESTNILNDLTREQQEFVREHGGSLQAGELPWNSEADETRSAYVREQILTLSQDKRNFVRAPPSDSDFVFDPKSCYPIALSLLREDPNLNKMRYELVPKLVNEDTFWCNYFYRVSMLKQMSEKGADAKKGWSSSRSSSGEGPDEVGSVDEHQAENEPFSPSYDTSTTKIADNTSNPSRFSSQQYTEQKQDSFSLVNTDRTDFMQPSTLGNIDSTEQQQQYQSNELESSESRKLVAEADDLKSRLRELNLGSFSIDGQDVLDDEKWDEEEFHREFQEFELISRRDISALMKEEDVWIASGLKQL